MSTRASKQPSDKAERPAVATAAMFVHGRPQRVRDAPERLRAVAERCGVEVVADCAEADLLVVLGGDGTMLRALHLVLGTSTPCLGVNFGRVGFLTSIESESLEAGVEQAFRGGFEVVELPTIVAGEGAAAVVGVNDIVLTSGLIGRMALLEWVVDGQSLGELGCDGAILSTPTGSTAYNLSAGGPVLAWGFDGFAISFVSPHSLHMRSMVLGRPHRVELLNRSPDVPLEVIVDGHIHRRLEPGARIAVAMGDARTHLARLSGMSFFSRYRETFSA
jgi:NAD+ kinase